MTKFDKKLAKIIYGFCWDIAGVSDDGLDLETCYAAIPDIKQLIASELPLKKFISDFSGKHKYDLIPGYNLCLSEVKSRLGIKS